MLIIRCETKLITRRDFANQTMLRSKSEQEFPSRAIKRRRVNKKLTNSQTNTSKHYLCRVRVCRVCRTATRAYPVHRVKGTNSNDSQYNRRTETTHRTVSNELFYFHRVTGSNSNGSQYNCDSRFSCASCHRNKFERFACCMRFTRKLTLSSWLNR